MPRNWTKVTERERKSATEVEKAVREVIEKKNSIRVVAEAYGISKSSLARYVSDAKRATDLSSYHFKPNIGNRRIFNCEQEILLSEYLKTASKMCYGLTTKQTRIMAYQHACALKVTMPPTWDQNQCAGIDWLQGFMDRHKELSIRSPEATSMSRASSFNSTNVGLFFNNLEKILLKYKITAERIFNCDETGLTTVTAPTNIIAERGIKQVGKVVSAERGQLVTMLGFINAIGNTIPPVFVFPRVNYKEFMLNGAPVGSLGLAYTSGWMTETNFHKALQHFVRHAKPNIANGEKVLLILDNHESHISLPTISYAKENGVILLTFPPHCSHRLQPLDVAVYGPFKARFRSVQDDWLTSNPGKRITIYEVAALAKEAFLSAFNPSNITSSFRKTGIYPLNKEIFTDNDYLPAAVTDQPNSDQANDNSFSEISTSSTSNVNLPSTSQGLNLTPQQIRPFPKVARKVTPQQKGRKSMKSCILTDTPEKERLEMEYSQKKIKKAVKGNKVRKVLAKKRLLESSSSESEQPLHFDDSTDEETFIEKDFDNSPIQDEDFVLTKYEKKQSVVYFVARVLNVQANDSYKVQFLKKKFDSYGFFYPQKSEICDILKSDIVSKLPKPQCQGGTERVKAFMTFDFDFTSINIQ